MRLADQAGRPSQGLHGITGGNPLFVTEVLAGVVDTVPATVRDAVLARTVRLSPGAREIAELVCVVPGKAERWLLEQAGRADEAGIEGCLSIGMVLHEDASLAFRHELARRAPGGILHGRADHRVAGRGGQQLPIEKGAGYRAVQQAEDAGAFGVPTAVLIRPERS